MVLNDLVDSPCYSQKNAGLKGLIKNNNLGCTELFFIDPGVKVDGRYYREVLMKKQMLAVMRHIAGDTYVFHQGSAPAHRARETVQLLQQQETPQFISPICGLLTARTYIQSTTGSGVGCKRTCTRICLSATVSYTHLTLPTNREV